MSEPLLDTVGAALCGAYKGSDDPRRPILCTKALVIATALCDDGQVRLVSWSSDDMTPWDIAGMCDVEAARARATYVDNATA